MRKYIIGALFGIFITLSSTSFAAELKIMIGQVVQGSFPLLIDGIKAEKDVIVVDNTSYVPVRIAGQLFGYDVSFIDSQVILNKNVGVNKMSLIPVTTGITETIYMGLKSIIYNGETYFSLREYSKKFDPISWEYNNDIGILTLAKHVNNSTTILEKYIQVNKDEIGAVIVYKGSTYINIKYYSEH